MRRILLIVHFAACGKHGERVVAAARDTIPITVTTNFPGASPAVIADSVTTPLERQLGQAAHLAALHSRSSEGRSVIVAEFAAGTDVDVASEEVQKAISATRQLLPQDLPSPPTYTRKGRTGAVLRLTLASQTLPLFDVAEVATTLVAQKLEQVAGVGEVKVCGPELGTRITIQPEMLAAMGKTVDDVRTAVKSAAAGSLPGGSLDTSGQTLSVTAAGDTVAALHAIPIVRDTARIEMTDVQSCVAIATGNARVVAVTVVPQVGVDPLELRARLEALVPRLEQAMPADLHVDIWPRTRPLAFEIKLGSAMSLAARVERLERALGELHLATRSLVQLGDSDRDPDLADLRIVPPEEHAQDIADDVALRFPHSNLTVLDPHDHVVGYAGTDVKELRAQAEALVAALANVKDLRVVDELGGTDQPRPVITIDRDRAAALGITPSAIATTLGVLAPGGAWVSTTFSQRSQQRVMLAVDGAFPDVLDQVRVRSTTGSLVPLSTVATVTETREPDVIFHEAQFPWVGVRVAGPLDALQNVLAKLQVPASIRRDVREPD